MVLRQLIKQSWYYFFGAGLTFVNGAANGCIEIYKQEKGRGERDD